MVGLTDPPDRSHTAVLANPVRIIVEMKGKGGVPMSPGSGNFIVEGLFVLTFFVPLFWPSGHRP